MCIANAGEACQCERDQPLAATTNARVHRLKVYRKRDKPCRRFVFTLAGCMPLSWIPIPALVLVLLLLLYFEARAPRYRRAAHALRVIATLLVAFVAALSFAQPIHLPLYSALVLVALGWSLVGDWLLIGGASDARRFARSVVAFAVAHGFYIAALSYVQVARGMPLNLGREGGLAAAIGVLALVVYVYLRPRLGESSGVVAIYVTMLSLMVHRAVSGVDVGASLLSQSVLAGAGAVLFYISDIMLAINRFVFNEEGAANSAWVLSTYYCAQLFLALSASYL